jgi:hypothetical protein
MAQFAQCGGGARVAALDDDLPLRAGVSQADELVMGVVELGRDEQFERGFVLGQLVHRQRQHIGVVAILDAKLFFEIGPRGQGADHEAAAEGRQGEHDDRQPELFDQGHGKVLSENGCVMVRSLRR